jgi:hypothetical protein
LGGGDNYIGFRFTGIDNLIHYGWANLFLDLNAGIVTIKDGAYNDVAGAQIHIADGPSSSVPEPSSLALLAIGAGGLAAFRRRKQRVAAAAA